MQVGESSKAKGWRSGAEKGEWGSRALISEAMGGGGSEAVTTKFLEAMLSACEEGIYMLIISFFLALKWKGIIVFVFIIVIELLHL